MKTSRKKTSISLESQSNLPEPEASRVRLFRVNERDVLLFCQDLSNFPDFIRVGRSQNLPPGSSIKRVWHDQATRSFVFMVEHPTFNLVAPGLQPPYSCDELEFSDVVFAREEDGRYRIEMISSENHS